MTLALASRRTALTPPWVRNPLWAAARAVPSLDLRFADNKSLADAVTGASLITFTRASSGTFVDSAGVIQTAATDVPRFDHNPTTGESLGLLVEEQRTNSIRNNTMVGAVAGTPGTNPTLWQYVTAQSNGLTVSVVGTGTESGINYIDYRFNGTTVASPSGIVFGFDVATAATAQTWTNSIYWKLAAGTATGVTSWQIGIIENTAGGAFVSGANYTQTAPTSAALITQRPAATRTLSGGGTVGQVQMTLPINVTGNTAMDFTIRIGLPQLEQGAFATSPILTSGAAATRNADLASISGSNFSSWFNASESTVSGAGAVTAISGNRNFLGITDNTSNERHSFRVGSSGTADYFCFDGGVQQVAFASSSGSITAQSFFRTAVAIKVNDFGNAVNGVNLGNSNGTLPTVDRVNIGADWSGSSFFNGTIRRLTYWPQRLANSTLQQITQ